MRKDDLKRNRKMEDGLRNIGGRHVTGEEQERETKTLSLRQLGWEMETVQSELDLSYRQRYQGVTIPKVYEHLILDMHVPLTTSCLIVYGLFEENKHLKEIFTPLLHHIDKGVFKSTLYQPGTRGPAKVDKLLLEKASYVQTHGYIWIPPTL
ncbi:hypothetical protein JHK87_011982 [Glycine soja]|nr:hypothetical protein JHK87_011982 [Glycine soja]